MDYTLHITYGIKPFTLQAQIVYHSNQIMRIKVYGKSSTLLLENNYPILAKSHGKKAIQWKLREGQLNLSDEKDAKLFAGIIKELEREIKGSGRGYYDRKSY
jgi:hypothetical protein